ncbi:MAG: hypothetical protein B6D46_12715 [Polyangiaceae bacterium UTPRO1]|nr:MAG: hypothetical protein B6D46_12715 [Polyangiaceae bacterium UTPRO1]
MIRVDDSSRRRLDRDPPDPCCRQVCDHALGGSAGADHRDARCEQALLPARSHLLQDDLAAVALDPFVVEPHHCVPTPRDGRSRDWC